jgi:hypothetical protein
VPLGVVWHLPACSDVIASVLLLQNEQERRYFERALKEEKLELNPSVLAKSI